MKVFLAVFFCCALLIEREKVFQNLFVRKIDSEAVGDGERVVGVQFTGPRFQRVFRSESAA